MADLAPSQAAPIPAPRAGVLLRAALAAALGVFALYQGLAMLRAGGVFEYPIDDVYIHLAIAAEIARGGYGVNAGEIASAASSILYPLLLTPLSETGLHRFLPLAWNTAALAASAALWALILAEAGYRRQALRRWGLALAVLGPIALNLPGVAFTGMENGLHTTAALALLFGLIRFLGTGRVGALLVLGVLLGPLLRYEGLALSLLAACVIAARGRRRTGLALGLGAVLPVAAFTAFLVANGLAPLPNSILAKLATSGADAGLLARIADRFTGNIATIPGAVLLALALALAAFALPAQGPGNAPRRLLALTATIGTLAHLAFGSIGWIDRYENYIIVFAAASAAFLAGPAAGLRAAGAQRWVTLGALLAAGLFYQNSFAARGQWSAAAVHAQHGQMARFAQDYARVPVAVNDLGRVAYRNPDYVLDLWGLASPTALQLRLSGTAPGWGAPLAEAKGVRLAMIYDNWVGSAAGPGWVRLGTLALTGPAGHLAGREVTFYATAPEDAPALTAALMAFVPTLPAGARFDFDPALPMGEKEDTDG